MRRKINAFRGIVILNVVVALLITSVPTVVLKANEKVIQTESETKADNIKEELQSEVLFEDTVKKEQILEEYQKYVDDGTYEERVAFMKELEAQKSNRMPKPVTYTSEEGATAKQSQIMPGSDFMPSTGEVKALVFLVDFPDLRQTDGTTAQSRKQQLFNLEDVTSFSGFYNASSYGKLKIDGDVYGYYTVEHPHDYYEDVFGRQELINEVLEYYDDIIDYSDYDADKDGIIDSLYIEYTGDDAGWGSFWWTYVTYWTEDAGQLVEADGMSINSYAWMNGESGNLVDVYKHETGHLLGLMDYYDVVSGTSDNSINAFDMMCQNEGDHNAYSKALLGWIDLIEVDTDTELELRSSQLYPEAAIIYPNKDKNSDEFFVVEYITADGANLYKQFDLDDGGIRVWRVNAKLDASGNGFIYRNISGSIKFIEAVGISNMSLGDGNYRVYDDKDQVVKANIYFEGDELTPYSNPSSYIHGERETDMSPLESAAGPLENSGIVMNNIQIADGTAKVDISYDFTQSEDFDYDIEYAFDGMLLAELTFDYETTLLDASKISVSDGDKELDITAEINYVPDSGYKKLYIVSDNKGLTETGTFTLKIDEGALVNLFGMYNPVITEEIEVSQISASLEKEYEISVGGYYTDVIDVDGKGYVFYENNNAIWLSQISKGQNGIETHEIELMEYANNPYLWADKVGDVLVLQVYDWNGVSGENSLYSVSLDGDCRLLCKIDCSNCPKLYVLDDKCLIYDYTQTLRLVDVATGDVKEIIANAGWALSALWTMGQGLYIADYENRLVMVDSQINVVQEVTKGMFNLSKTEHIVDFIEKNGSIIMLSLDKNGADADWYMTYLDENFNAVSKKKFLNDSLFGVSYKGINLIECENGYAIKMGLAKSSMLRFITLFEKSYEVADICRIAYFDEDMQYVTSKIFWDVDSDKVSIGTIGEEWIYLHSCDDASMQLYDLEKIQLVGQEKEVVDISLNRKEVVLSQGKKYRLRETYNPYNVATEIVWTSSNEDVATVDANGYITAVGVGEAIISVTVGGNNLLTKSCLVKVPESKVFSKNGLYKDTDGELYYFKDDQIDTTYNGVADYENEIWCVKNGKVDISVSGLANAGGTWYLFEAGKVNRITTVESFAGSLWYVENGQIDFNRNGLHKNGNWYYFKNGAVNAKFEGLINSSDGWLYLKKGQFDSSYDGVADYAGSTWYIKNGKIDFGQNGLQKCGDGWYYFKNGAVDTKFTGLTNSPYGWWYIENGILEFDYTNLVYYGDSWWYVQNSTITFTYDGVADYAGSTWYIEDSRLVQGKNGLQKCGNEWYYFKNSIVDTRFTGLTNSPYGWWYIENGKLEFDYTNLVYYGDSWWYVQNSNITFQYDGVVNYAGSTWYIEDSRLVQGKNGLQKCGDEWYYFKNSAVDTKLTGLANSPQGWWYIEAGKLEFDYTNLVYYGDSWWYVQNSNITFKYDGIVDYAGSKWYIQDSRLDASFSGMYEFGGKIYKVVNGMATLVE